MALSIMQQTNTELGLDQERFVALWQRCARGDIAESSAPGVFKRVCDHYQEPHRHYHTPEHILHCLQQFDEVKSRLQNPDAVELAIWFHDVIYQPKAKDNELRSAQLFEQLSKGELDAEIREQVYQLIMVTVHPSEPMTGDQQYMVDIDLSSFGLPRQRFDRDSRSVRDEFNHMSDADYYLSQQRFLQSLLNREYFFFTPEFRGRKEASARENIQKYLAEVEQAGLLQ